MQIVIPMSGFGERFKKVGYKVPKPLIEVEGLKIINHVVKMFSNRDKFLFICNENHLRNTKFQLKKILKQSAKNVTIRSIKAHKKGPSYAVSKVMNDLDMTKPVVVNYCDFTCYWKWNEFKEFVKNTNCDGCIPAYKGFHPHSGGKTNYAYIKNKKNIALDIQEKKPFTKNKLQEFASSGTYYFSSGQLLKDSIKYQLKNNLNIKGEFYISLAYKYLFDHKLNTLIYPLQHFMQWGTPEDLDEYKFWSDMFKQLTKQKKIKSNLKGINIMPMAGLGKRFSNKGYKTPKPLLNISEEPMVVQAMKDVHIYNNKVVILRKTKHSSRIINNIKSYYSDIKPIILNKETDGQASSVNIAINRIMNSKKNLNDPILIGACDTGVVFSFNKYKHLTNKFDILVWGIRGLPKSLRNPEMFGWIKQKNEKIKFISVKKPLENLNITPIVLGIFYFKNSKYFKQSYENLIKNKDKVNGEYYIDSLINHSISLGYKCGYFEVDAIQSWGTPEDYETYNYWQSCFHKWKYHPYSIHDDIHVKEKHKKKLLKKFF